MDVVERYVENFMERLPIQQSLFLSPEEMEAAVRDIARQGVTIGLCRIKLQTELIDTFNRPFRRSQDERND